MTPTPAGAAPAARPIACWLIVVCLAVCVPLQAASAIVASLLGPRHSHASFETEADSAAQNPMADWPDFCRVQHDDRAALEANVEEAHRLAHEAGFRHRHVHDDAGVNHEETTGIGDAIPGGMAQTCAIFVFLGADCATRIPSPVASVASAWHPWQQGRLPPAHARRIGRPPQRV